MLRLLKVLFIFFGLIFTGWGGIASVSQAMPVMEAADGYYQKGRTAFSAQNYPEAFNAYSEAVKIGHLEAQYALAGLYAEGTGVEKDEDKAFELYLDAATQGHAYSQLVVAAAYLFGFGDTAINKSEGHRWMLLSAEQGNANAQFILAGLYILGEGTVPDASQAVLWLKKAAEQGHNGAQQALLEMGIAP